MSYSWVETPYQMHSLSEPTNEKTMYNIQIDFDEAEFTRVIDALQKNKPKHQWYWPVVIVGAFAVIAVLVSQLMFSSGPREVASSTSNYIPMLLLLFLLIGLKIWGSRLLSRLAKLNASTVTDGFMLSLTDDSISRNMNGESLDIDWNKIERAIETDEFILFYCDGFQAFYVPKRLLKNELAGVRKLLTEALQERFNSHYQPT